MDSKDLRRAAIVVASLPKAEAASLLGKLPRRLVASVSVEIARLGRLNPQEQRDALDAFRAANPHQLGGVIGGLDYVSSLISDALGGDAEATIGQVRSEIESRPFAFLAHADAQNLLTVISDEHPQTLALVLSHLPSGTAASLLGKLSPEQQLSVAERIARMEQTSPEMMAEVEAALQARISKLLGRSLQQIGGVPCVAAILNVIDRPMCRKILEGIAEEDPELMDSIQRLMFVFEDIVKLGDREIQTLLKHVESAKWAVALKGSRNEMKEKILGNMSKRAAAMLSEEMELLGKVKLSDVESAQQFIVDLVRKLEDTGEITTQGGRGAEEYVE